LKDALEQLNSATLSVQKMLEDYRSRIIPVWPRNSAH
jgi:hypothetical protein